MVGESALNCLYAAALLVGFLYALFLLFFQGVGHAFDLSDVDLFGHPLDFGELFHFGGHVDLAGHDVDVSGHDGHEASGLSMLAISGFITAFGAFGLAATFLLQAPPLLSLLAAVVGGVLVGLAAQVFFIQVLSPTTSSNVQLSSLKGAPAEVIVPIPATGRGVIACVVGGQRLTLSASSSSGVAIARGTPAIIDSIHDGVAHVSPRFEA